MVNTYPAVDNAILVLGHQPDRQGNIKEGVRRRADLALQLYNQGVAPVIIPSGWFWPKNPALAKFPEARVIEAYLNKTDPTAKIICEDHSTSIPENLLFTNFMFPGLHRLTIVSGELFMERTKALAQRTFNRRVSFNFVPCQDGLSDAKNQQRLLANVQCILTAIEQGTLEDFKITSSNGILKSNWQQLNKMHKETCPTHGETN